MNQTDLEKLLATREQEICSYRITAATPSSPNKGQGAKRLAALVANHSPRDAELRHAAYAGVQDWARCLLIDFRGDAKLFPGRQGHQVLRLQQIPLYYAEVKDYVPIDASDIERRHELAVSSGFLLLGPDECIAIVFRNTLGESFCEVYENNELGKGRAIHGIYDFGLDFHARLKSISELNVTQTKEAIRDTVSSLAIGLTDSDLSESQTARLRKTLELLTAHEGNAPAERTSSGAIIKRWNISGGDIDSVRELRAPEDGWRRYSTWQDAWYFGVWINPRLRQTLTYAEGDASLVICESEQQFQFELQSMAQFYGRSRGYDAIGLGAEGVTRYYSGLYLLDGQTEECVLSERDSAHDPSFNGGAPLLCGVRVDHPTLTALKPGERIAADPEFFSMDLYSPLAYTEHRAEVTKTLSGYQVDVYCGVLHHIGLIQVAISKELVT